MLLSYDLITFQILGQKSVKFWGGFLENPKFQKDILKLSDLYQGGVKSTVFGVFEDLKIKISKGYKQN